MQVRGTFPELNRGDKKPRSKSRARNTTRNIASTPEVGSSFGVSGRVRNPPRNPRSFAGRRAASRKVYC